MGGTILEYMPTIKQLLYSASACELQNIETKIIDYVKKRSMEDENCAARAARAAPAPRSALAEISRALYVSFRMQVVRGASAQMCCGAVPNIVRPVEVHCSNSGAFLRRTCPRPHPTAAAHACYHTALRLIRVFVTKCVVKNIYDLEYYCDRYDAQRR
ncbi:hypothetical protein EVAR_24227_1 [Eumeta japonica]|uniref:Uncharacterized protein n=1 Tax=Eumeta variegata TaxID=151549 RepID=A0A4C1W4U7_EUMVA|nr:hypothetical protein EVAR_24227_1 [Eumeta japonica]